MWALYYFAKEAKLSSGNHVYDTWNVIEHLTNVLIAGVVFLNLHYEDAKYLPDATMKENFKSSKKILLKQPILTSPQKKVHRDHAKEKILAVRI